jgi:hypothetical protein
MLIRAFQPLGPTGSAVQRFRPRMLEIPQQVRKGPRNRKLTWKLTLCQYPFPQSVSNEPIPKIPIRAKKKKKKCQTRTNIRVISKALLRSDQHGE